MRLPNSEECRRVLSEIEGDPALTEWEAEFIEANAERWEFTDAQKEVVARMLERFDV